MQFQVPQFIESEDKIIGPLSLKQFMYIAIAGFLMFLLFFIIETIVWAILAFFVMAAAVALAFVKYNGKPLPSVLAALFKYIWQPKFFLWSSKRAEAEQRNALPAKPAPEAFIAENRPAKTLTANEIAAAAAEKSRHAFAAGETASAEPEREAGLDSLWLHLATSKGKIEREEGASLAEPKKSKEIFELFQKITGEREVARRVDYR